MRPEKILVSNKPNAFCQLTAAQELTGVLFQMGKKHRSTLKKSPQKKTTLISSHPVESSNPSCPTTITKNLEQSLSLQVENIENSAPNLIAHNSLDKQKQETGSELTTPTMETTEEEGRKSFIGSYFSVANCCQRFCCGIAVVQTYCSCGLRGEV